MPQIRDLKHLALIFIIAGGMYLYVLRISHAYHDELYAESKVLFREMDSVITSLHQYQKEIKTNKEFEKLDSSWVALNKDMDSLFPARNESISPETYADFVYKKDSLKLARLNRSSDSIQFMIDFLSREYRALGISGYESLRSQYDSLDELIEVNSSEMKNNLRKTEFIIWFGYLSIFALIYWRWFKGSLRKYTRG